MNRFLAFVLVFGGFLLSGPPASVRAQPADEERMGTSDGTTESIFNGEDLAGWEGDPRFWSVENGAIVGQTTPDNPTEENTFLVWKGKPVEDFRLTFEARLTGGNSGVQYRSTASEDWVASGYQADMDAENRYTGMLYEENGRGILTRRGQEVVIDSTGEVNVVGSVGDPDSLGARIDMAGWNEYEIVARGARLIHRVNGHVTMKTTDREVGARSASGVLALQIHAGPPMKVEFRDLELTRLASDSTEAK